VDFKWARGVYAWLMFYAGGKKDYVQTAENRISGCLASCNEQAETGGVCFERMRIISTLLSLRGDNVCMGTLCCHNDEFCVNDPTCQDNLVWTRPVSCTTS